MSLESITVGINIRPRIIWYHARHCVLQNFNLDISQSVCISSWSISRSYSVCAYCKSMPHPKGKLACVIDLIGDQLILSQRNICRVSSYCRSSLTLPCILTQSGEHGCFRPLIISKHHNSLGHVMLGLRLFSLAGEYRGGSYLLWR